MFTGLVQDIGTLVRVTPRGGVTRIAIEPGRIDPTALALGESVAAAGVCLTVVAVTERSYEADLGAETLARTTASSWRVGRRLNLERALALGDRLGGHLVLGHVDGVGTVRERRAEGGVLHLRVEMPESIAPLVCEKGSIAVDGVSLTVNAVDRTTFSVTLIPETLERTTLGTLGVGDAVNLEADILARQIARLVGFGATTGGLDLTFLARHGYGPGEDGAG